MGEPKASLELARGDRLLDRVHRALTEVGLPVILVGDGPVTPDTAHLARITDAPGVQGPLGGILGALDHDPAVTWLVVACDLALIRPAAVRWLLDQAAPGDLAILPRLTDRRIEPLFALYAPGSEALLRSICKSGTPAPKRLEHRLGVVTPEPPLELRGCWSNINTPDQVAALSTHDL